MAESKDMLETETVMETVKNTCTDNMLLSILTVVVWGAVVDMILKGEGITNFFTMTYFVYFGFFVFFAGYFPPCLVFCLNGGPCIKDPPHRALAKGFEKIDGVSNYLQQVPKSQASLWLNVCCSHKETHGSGKNRRTVTVTTHSDSKEFKCAEVKDASDSADEWLQAVDNVHHNIFRLKYEFEFKMGNGQDVVDAAMNAYYEENKSRDATCNVTSELRLACGKNEGVIFSKGFFCLPRFFLNRLTLGIMSYAGLLLLYLIIYNFMCKKVTYHCNKIFYVSPSGSSFPQAQPMPQAQAYPMAQQLPPGLALPQAQPMGQGYPTQGQSPQGYPAQAQGQGQGMQYPQAQAQGQGQGMQYPQAQAQAQGQGMQYPQAQAQAQGYPQQQPVSQAYPQAQPQPQYDPNNPTPPTYPTYATAPPAYGDPSGYPSTPAYPSDPSTGYPTDTAIQMPNA